MVMIAPSLLAANFAHLAEQVKKVEAAGVEYLHLDIMDGHFVPNISLGPGVVANLREVTSLPFDVHLMVEKPENYLEAFVEAGADIISVHAEACTHLHRVLEKIRELGARPAVALNPATPLEILSYIVPQVEMVLLLTVNPGFGGQQYLKAMEPKIALLKEMLEASQQNVLLEVDGGINLETAPGAVVSGADILVSGSAIFGSADIGETIRRLRECGRR